MNKPVKYKSKEITLVTNRPITPLVISDKIKASNILTKMIQFIKQKHS
jgi:hypothetical protein